MFSQVGFELHYGLLESKALLELGHESLPESGKTSKRKHVQYSSLGLMKSFTFPKESTHVQDVHGAQNFSGHHTPRTCQTSLDASKGQRPEDCPVHQQNLTWWTAMPCNARCTSPLVAACVKDFPKADNDAIASKSIQACLNYTKDRLLPLSCERNSL